MTDKVVPLNKDAEVSKNYSIEITLKPEPLAQAKAALTARGMDFGPNFRGPLFKDIMGYQLNGDWIAVSLTDGTTYVYPANDIARVKHFISKEAE